MFFKPKEVFSHLFLVSPQIFTLSSWSVVTMTAEEGLLTSRLKHKIDNQASWVLLNSATCICIAYQGFGLGLFKDHYPCLLHNSFHLLVTFSDTTTWFPKGWDNSSAVLCRVMVTQNICRFWLSHMECFLLHMFVQ